MLRTYDFLRATVEYAQNIRTMATTAGVPQKFNAYKLEAARQMVLMPDIALET